MTLQRSSRMKRSPLKSRRSRKRRTSARGLTPGQRRRRFDALAAMGCIVCGAHPEIHHLRGHPWSGAGQRAGDEHTIPLCRGHHRGDSLLPGVVGYHESPAEFERQYGTQADLLEQVEQRLREAA